MPLVVCDLQSVSDVLSSLQSAVGGGITAADNATWTRHQLASMCAALNSTDAWSAVALVDQLAADTDALDARRAAAAAAVRRAAAETHLLAAGVAELRARVSADGGGGGRTAGLRDDVRRTRDDVRGRAWQSVARQVRETIDEQQAWIDGVRLRRDELQAQLDRVTTLLAMLD